MKTYYSSVINKYLQSIYTMLENHETVKAVKLSKRLNSSASTVHATLFRMQRDGLIFVNEKKMIFLTNEGTDHAVSLVRRRRLTEKLLCEKLGIPLQEAVNHISLLIQGFTPLVEKKLAEYLGNPKICPHGKPIPHGKQEINRQTVIDPELKSKFAN